MVRIILIVFFLVCSLDLKSQEKFPNVFVPSKDSVYRNQRRLDTIFSQKIINLKIQYGGCFASGMIEFQILKKRNIHIIHAIAYRNKEKIKCDFKKRLNKTEFKRFQTIFIRGISIPFGLCTSKSYFEIQGGNFEVKFIDGRCSDVNDSLTELYKVLRFNQFFKSYYP